MPEIMDDEEQAIAASTPGYRIGAPAPSPQAAKLAPVEAPEPEPEAVERLDAIICDDEEPVVMFALEWCEFCWALRKFFDGRNIPYRSVDLDSVAWQKDNLGGDLRVALHARTGSPTIPQVFIGGRHVGGCTETFDYFREGRLQRMLAEKPCRLPGRCRRRPLRLPAEMGAPALDVQFARLNFGPGSCDRGFFSCVHAAGKPNRSTIRNNRNAAPCRDGIGLKHGPSRTVTRRERQGRQILSRRDLQTDPPRRPG
ncbi:glutaredoxin domain-containing protein [Roseibium salinum]|nr:glutaredoxin domain-containing protein [Roseibium salinum]